MRQVGRVVKVGEVDSIYSSLPTYPTYETYPPPPSFRAEGSVGMSISVKAGCEKESRNLPDK